jgi:predicted PurR-regulated permease PerM
VEVLPREFALRRTARRVFAVLLLLLAGFVARQYLDALAWAVIIAVALWPLYRRLVPPGRQRRLLPPLLFTAAVALLLLLPLAVVAVEAGREVQVAAGWAARAQESGLPEPPFLARLPFAGERAAGWWRDHLGNPQAASELLGRVDKNRVAGWSQAFGAELLERLVTFLVAMLALFVLFRDGDRLGAHLLGLADRWLGDPGERLAERLAAVVRGTVNGTVLVAVGEGTLIGVGCAVAGVPHPLLFGGLAAACALLPLGAWFAFGAASLLLLAEGGGALAAGGLFAYGAAVMLVGDNFVQPALIGGAARLPFLAALIGILGGLGTFGLVGLFLGPAIMAALVTVWREWLDRPAAG